MAQNFASLAGVGPISNPSVLELLSNSFATIRPDLFQPGNFTINPGLLPGLQPGVIGPGIFTPGTGGPSAAPTGPSNGSQTVLPRVRPGDVITADLVNLMLELLETLAAGLAGQAAAVRAGCGRAASGQSGPEHTYPAGPGHRLRAGRRHLPGRAVAAGRQTGAAASTW